MARSGPTSPRATVMVMVIIALAFDNSAGLAHTELFTGLLRLIGERSWLLPIQSGQALHPAFQSNSEKLTGWSTILQNSPMS